MQALVLLRFENGALVHCNFNETAAHPQNDITIHGSAGRMVGTGFTRSRTDGRLAVRTEGGEMVTDFPAPDAHRLAVAAFTGAVLRGDAPNGSGQDGLRSATVCDAIRRSAMERRLVEVESG